MDTDWCLTCNRQTSNDIQGYCSKKCRALDLPSVVRPLPFHARSHRPSFELPAVSRPRHIAHPKCYTRREAPAHTRTSESNSKRTAHSSARFRDEELVDPHPNPCASRWTGRDRAGILVWANSVLPGVPGHEEEYASPSIETSSMSELDRLLRRHPPRFPLTAQNLAPPCVIVTPRHALLNHTSTHYPSNPEDRAAPSLSLDDASLLTPATDSVITPSRPSKPDNVPSPFPKTNPILGSLVNKLCTWIVSPSRDPRAAVEGNPNPPPQGDRVAVHTDETASCYSPSHYGDKSSAEAVLSLTSPTDTRLRVTPISREDYE